MGPDLIRLGDVIVVFIGLALMIYIGLKCAKNNKSSEDYFMAGRKMPGWVVGISFLASMISSIGFLAVPGFAYKKNWLYLAQYCSFILPLIVACLILLPFYRRTRIATAFEYLEKRFGPWARFYAAIVSIIGTSFFLGTIIYTISLPIQMVTGLDVRLIITVFGVLVAVYTVVGGLEAVIWTDLLQGGCLLIGAIISLPLICFILPGGIGQIISEGYTDGKMSLGNMAFNLNEKGFWVILIGGTMTYLNTFATNQIYIQRYCAPKSSREARKAVILGCFAYLPVMFYFMFLGTALYVLYKNFPSSDLAEMKPEQVFPYFIFTRVPVILAGIIIVGVLAAAMSTLDSIINAWAAIITNDIYRRLIAPKKEEKDYLVFGRKASCFLATAMIVMGIWISYSGETIVDLIFLISVISNAGICGLFMVGFLTTKAHSRVAIITFIMTMLIVCFWLFAISDLGERYVPYLSQKLPNIFWLGIIANLFMFCSTYFLSLLIPTKSTKDLKNLTVWTMQNN